MSFIQLLNYFIILLVICNPLSALPVFLNLTADRSLHEKKRIALGSCFAVAVILVSVTWLGTAILDLVGVRITSFQVAGGFIVATLGFSMLNATPSRLKHDRDAEHNPEPKASITVVPLAIPLMAGPGAISSVIVKVTELPGFYNQVLLTLVGLAVAGFLALTLYYAVPLENKLGKTGINLINRIGGLLLASIGVDTMSMGLSGMFPGLVGSF